jgi:hypothetical protein
MPPHHGMEMDTDFKLKGDFLYRGQGKDNRIVNNDSYTNNSNTMDVVHSNSTRMEDLRPFWLAGLGDIVRGENKTLMRKENKGCKHRLKVLQEAATQGHTHKGRGDMSMTPMATPSANY